jgi:hypothetical protein
MVDDKGWIAAADYNRLGLRHRIKLLYDATQRGIEGSGIRNS